MLDLVIQNGIVVNSDQSSQLDIAIQNGKIVALGNKKYFPEAQKVIDAKGKYVMPGMIDSHVHVNLQLGNFTSLDNFQDASLAAVHGGTTSIIEFAIPYKNETPLQAVERRLEESAGKTLVDYSFHGCITKGGERAYGELKELISGGIPSIKMFTIYKDVGLSMGVINEVLKVTKNNGLALFHAESEDMIEHNIRKRMANNETEAQYHALTRPPITEASAISSLLTLIKEENAPSLFVHVSTGMAKELLRTHRLNNTPVYVEVCPHYLTINDSAYNSGEGHKFICSPPLRSQSEQDALWEMIQEGLVDVVNSDHTAYDTIQKSRYKNDFTKCPNGLPGIETRGQVLFSEGVSKGKITVNQFVNLTSTKIAKIMGMYPQKGIIAVDSDADIVIFNPESTYQLTIDELHMHTDYTPFEGMMLSGKPIHTIVRGHHLIENGRLLDNKFRGQFLKRKSPLIN